MQIGEPAASELLVGNHALLGTIEGGGRGVEVDADGAASWRGSKQPGAAGFFPAGRRMRSRWPAGSLTYVALFIEPEATSQLLDRNVATLAWQTRPSAEDKFLSATMHQLASVLGHADNPLAALAAETMATSLHIHAVSRFTDLQTAPGACKDSLGRVLDLIHAELPRALTLAEMVAVSGLPRGRFLATFRARTGVSPHQYVLRERLARARSLLETTRRSVGEVAAEVGCANAGHLGQMFRQHLGVSPHAWRRSRYRT